MSQKYRISYNLDTPVRFMGFTLDEGALALAGLGAFFFCDNKILGISLALIFGVVVFSLKRLKKSIEGFKVRAFCRWYLGYPKGDESLPPSHIRRIG